MLIGLPSSGLHTNGYSLARTIVFERLKLGVHDRVPELGATVGEALLAPHRSYLPVSARCSSVAASIKGMAHITGGGITDNLPRVLPAGHRRDRPRRIVGGAAALPVAAARRRRAAEDMLRTFNMGVGLILVVAAADADRVIAALRPRASRAPA